MPDSSEPVFRREGESFIPTVNAGSPWGAALVHGGPPSGLLARAIEREAVDREMHVTRLTVDLFHPVPKQPLTVQARTIRQGKRIQVVEASLFAAGIEVSRATGLLLRQSEIELPDHHRPPALLHPSPEGIPSAGTLSEMLAASRAEEATPPPTPSPALMLPGFHSAVEARRVGGKFGSGHAIAWIRIPVPFIEGEETSALTRVAATADFGNALGHIRPSDNVGFINADITLYVHRLPAGEWICLEATSSAQPCGLGIVDSVVYDTEGTVGRVVQALIVNERAR
jgi:acyl-CoA thioesterase